MANGEASTNNKWTIETLHEYYEALRKVDEKFQTERDRRYTEVNIEREKALKIKEEADKAALSLAREIQVYKDEKANELREQLAAERLDYASKSDLVTLADKFDAITKPLLEYVQSQRGGSQKLSQTAQVFLGIFTVVAVVIAAIVAFR